MKLNRNSKKAIITILLIIAMSFNERLLLETHNSNFLINFNNFSNMENRAAKLKYKTTAIDRKFLPYTQPIKEEREKTKENESKLFQPIRINFVHVDEKIEYQKRKSPFDEETYRKFLEIVMNPVNDYFKKIIKVYPLGDDVDVQCESMVQDKNKNKIAFRQKIGQFIKNFVINPLLIYECFNTINYTTFTTVFYLIFLLYFI